MIVLILTMLLQAEPSGMFHEEGRRGEEYLKDGAVPAEVREKLNTIEDWGRIASTAKSQTFRVGAATTLAWVGRHHKEKVHSLTQEELEELRKQATALCKSKDEKVRFFAVNTLGFVGDKTTIPPLLELLGDKNAFMRLAVVESLETNADDSCIEPLMATLKKLPPQTFAFSPRELVTRTLTAVANIGSEKAKKALEKAESTTRDPEMKEAIRVALDKWQSAKVP